MRRLSSDCILHDIGHWPYCHPIEDMDYQICLVMKKEHLNSYQQMKLLTYTTDRDYSQGKLHNLLWAQRAILQE